MLLGRHAGLGWRHGAIAGAISGLLNLLILGSFVTGDEPNRFVPSALWWIPGSILVSALLAGAGASAGARWWRRPEPYREWSATFARVAIAAALLLLGVGGLVTSALDISKLIKKLPDEGIRTVAWVNDQAYSAGALISVAAQEILMSSTASIGDCAPIMVSPVGGMTELGETERAKAESPILQEFRDSAIRNDYDTLLCRAMVTVGVEFWWLENIESGEREFVDANKKKELIDDTDDPLRKAQYQFGWDWCPTLPGCGIWRPLRIEAIVKARIANLHIRTIHCDENSADIRVAVKLDRNRKKKFQCALDIFGDNQQRSFGFCSFLKKRHELGYVADFFLVDEDKWLIQLADHIFRVSDKMRRKITAVELHTFDKLDCCLKTFTFFDRDNAVFADFLEGFGHFLADFNIVVSRY